MKKIVFIVLYVFFVMPENVLANNRPPNIVFVLLDDLDNSASAHFMKKVMPFTTTQTEKRGVRLEGAHSAAICCEARAAILTGRYAHNNGVFTNGGPWGGYSAFLNPKDKNGQPLLDAYGERVYNEERTLARYMHDAGYYTGFLGKYFNGFERDGDRLPHALPYWDEGAVYVDPGIQSYTGYRYEMLRWQGLEKNLEVYGSSVKEYATDVLSAKAKQFFENAARIAPNKPRFLYLAYTAPHLPLPPAPRHFLPWFFSQGTLPQKPNTFADGTDGFTDKPDWLQTSVSNRMRPAMQTWAQYDWANRLGSLLAVDEGIQSLWSFLESIGEAERTLIVVTSDNGYNNGAHGLVHKMAPYEETLKVPLYVFGGEQVPMQRGAVKKGWVSHVDYLPTFVELAGEALPEGLDGKSFLPLLQGRVQNHRSEIFFSYQGNQLSIDGEIPLSHFDSQLFGGLRAFFYDVPTHLGLKKHFVVASREYQFKIILWSKQDEDLFVENGWSHGEWEIYDLIRDPFELHNLLATRADACGDLQAYLRESLVRSFQCKGQECWHADIGVDAFVAAAADRCINNVVGAIVAQ